METTTLIPVVIPALIGAGVATLGAVISHLLVLAKHSQQLENHEKRMDSLEDKFNNLGTTFVPRPELEAIMKSVQESLTRIEGWFQKYFLDRSKE